MFFFYFVKKEDFAGDIYKMYTTRLAYYNLTIGRTFAIWFTFKSGYH